MKPREFELKVRSDGCVIFVKAIGEFPTTVRSDERIRVQEILPGITDAKRLEFMIENNVLVANDGNGFYCVSYPLQIETDVFDTQREAIDAAMKEEKK